MSVSNNLKSVPFVQSLPVFKMSCSLPMMPTGALSTKSFLDPALAASDRESRCR